jgi:hypothetical protein
MLIGTSKSRFPLPTGNDLTLIVALATHSILGTASK